MNWMGVSLESKRKEKTQLKTGKISSSTIFAKDSLPLLTIKSLAG